MNEFDLIEKFLKPLSTKEGPAFSLSNDAAVFSPLPGRELVLTNDTLVSDVHFFSDDDPYFLAKKSLRVNLSDLAAMGAVPLGYMLSLSLPKTGFDKERWIKRFSDGLRDDQGNFGFSLWGGDTVSTPGPLTISVTAIGDVDKGRFASRSGAAVGDRIYVSGKLGDAAAGLELIKNNIDCEDKPYFIGKYHLPEPRLALGQALVPLVSSMMDLSDGLMGDIEHICRHSGVGARVVSSKIPVSHAFSNLLETKSEYDSLKWCGGDDYELLFTIAEKNLSLLSELSERFGIALSNIGEITEGNDAELIGDNGSRSVSHKTGFRHF